MATKKKTTKTADLKGKIAKTESDINAARLAKVTKLAEAKKEHDRAVQKVKEDELAEYCVQVEQFAKRVPFLCSLAKKLSEFTTVPTLKLDLGRANIYSYQFGLYRYTIGSMDSNHWCIGCRSDRACADFWVIDETGVWLDDKVQNKSICAERLSKGVDLDRFMGPNAKEFMLAAVEWEKKLIDMVDAL